MIAQYRQQRVLVINSVVLMETNITTGTRKAAESLCAFFKFVPLDSASSEGDKLLFNFLNNAGCLRSFQLIALWTFFNPQTTTFNPQSSNLEFFNFKLAINLSIVDDWEFRLAARTNDEWDFVCCVSRSPIVQKKSVTNCFWKKCKTLYWGQL